MHRRKALLLLFAIMFFTFKAGGQYRHIHPRELGLSNPVSSYLYKDSSGTEALLFDPDKRWSSLYLKDSIFLKELLSKKYLVLDLWHDNPYSLLLNFEFYTPHDPKRGKMKIRLGILPYLDTRVITPTSYLDGQEIFLPRMPRQLKGVVSGRRVDQDTLTAVRIYLEPFRSPGFTPSCHIRDVWLSDEIPEALPPPEEAVVDSFGQWTAKEWPGKIKHDSVWRNQLDSLYRYTQQPGWPEEWSRYGGYRGIRFDATGFFRTHYDGKRWWLVDPEGYAFLSAGLDCVHPNSTGVVEGQEDLYEWLPDPGGKYRSAYSKSRDMTMINFQRINLIRYFGKDWKTSWDSLIVSILKQWRFNTIGNWSDIQLARKARIPYVLPLSRFPSTPVNIFRDFPDVYDPVYRENAIEFAKQLEYVKEDPYLIGYFLRNEPQWAFGDHNLALEMFGDTSFSHTKEALVGWLKERYPNNRKFSAAWHLPGTRIDDLLSLSFADPPGGQAEEDLEEFSKLMVCRYITVVSEAIEAVDPNHLNLGMRYAWISSDLCYEAGKYFDVFSINGYNFPAPPDTKEITKRTGKPVMIGEFHFGSIDRGLPATGIRGVASQENRGKAYSYYLEQGFSRPELIGIHYFLLHDQLITGRFDGENYNVGFLDVTLRPYTELIRRARESHGSMYEIARGRQSPTGRMAVPIPEICY